MVCHDIAKAESLSSSMLHRRSQFAPNIFHDNLEIIKNRSIKASLDSH